MDEVLFFKGVDTAARLLVFLLLALVMWRMWALAKEAVELDAVGKKPSGWHSIRGLSLSMAFVFLVALLIGTFAWAPKRDSRMQPQPMIQMMDAPPDTVPQDLTAPPQTFDERLSNNEDHGQDMKQDFMMLPVGDPQLCAQARRCSAEADGHKNAAKGIDCEAVLKSLYTNPPLCVGEEATEDVMR